MSLVRWLRAATGMLLLGGLVGVGTVQPDAGAKVPVTRAPDAGDAGTGALGSAPKGDVASGGPTTTTAAASKHGTEAKRGGGPGPADKPRLTAPQRDPNSTMELDVTVTPGCAKRGRTVEVVARTTPWASVAAAASYSDYDGHGNYTLSAAGPDGVWRWTFVVPPKAPDGHGEIMVSAQQRSGPQESPLTTSDGRAASVRTPFEVSNDC